MLPNRLTLALAAVLAAPFVLAGEPFVVTDIRVEGIQRTEAGTVFSYLPVKVGEAEAAAHHAYAQIHAQEAQHARTKRVASIS